jgi:DNA-binding CsgD family transcriptional regulator
VIGREPELAVLEEFLGWDTPSLALLLAGGQCIGKTALGEEGLRQAGERGIRVLAARPSGAEAELSSAGIFDLLAGIEIGAVGGLPVPQRLALEAALLRAQPAGAPPERFAIDAGFFSVLRSLAAIQPVLLAVDDLQWLDATSADVLAFAARRARGQRFRFLLTRRSGPDTGMEGDLGPAGMRSVEVGALSPSATRRLLSKCLGLRLPPRTLGRVFDATQGNPLLALELGRALAGGRTWEVGAEPPVADPQLRATALATKSRLLALVRVERIGEAEALAAQACQLARSARPEVERHALNSLAWARILRGCPVGDLGERFRGLPGMSLLAGRPGEMERWAATAAAPSATGDPWDRWDELELLRAEGIAALLAREPERAASALTQVWEHTRREGVADPGAFPVASDLVEALVWLGRITEADAVTGHLYILAKSQEHPWGLTTASRCVAVIRLAAGYDEHAAAQLADAASSYGELGLGFDQARSLLWLGRQTRRARKRGAARRLLVAASNQFGRLGSDGWAGQALAELDLLGSPGAPPGALTPAERRVVELAASGLPNKQIARRLSVAVHTVEVHLSHAYAKLGVRSRAQLASHFTPPAPPQATD